MRSSRRFVSKLYSCGVAATRKEAEQAKRAARAENPPIIISFPAPPVHTISHRIKFQTKIAFDHRFRPSTRVF